MAAAASALDGLAEEKKAVAKNLLASAAELLSNASAPVVEQEVVTSSGAVMKVAVFQPSGNSTEDVAVSGEGGVEVKVPTNVLDQLAGKLAGPVALSVGNVPNNTKDILESVMSQQSDSASSTASTLTSEPLAITLYDADGNELSNLTFEEPLELVLQGTADPKAVCVFWDEQAGDWSKEGVQRVSSDPSKLVCSTTHLSIFAAIIEAIEDTFSCSQAAAIFSSEGFRSLFSGDWWSRFPAMLNWMSFVLGAVILYLAHRADRKHADVLDALETAEAAEGATSDEETQVEAVAAERAKDPAESAPKTSSAAPRKFTLRWFWRWLARWSIYQVLFAHVGTDHKLLKRSFSETGLTKAHEVAESTATSAVRGSSWRKLLLFFTVWNEWLAFALPDLGTTCRQRSAAVFARLIGCWATSALFFNSSARGNTDVDPRCTREAFLADPLRYAVRAALVGVISLVVGSLPIAALLALSRARRNDRWKILKGSIYWFFIVGYSIFCDLVLCIFLAHVSPLDAEIWALAGLTSFITSLAVFPILVTLAVAPALLWLSFNKDVAEQMYSDICPWLESKRRRSWLELMPGGAAAETLAPTRAKRSSVDSASALFLHTSAAAALGIVTVHLEEEPTVEEVAAGGSVPINEPARQVNAEGSSTVYMTLPNQVQD